jgi:hypothetical protein
MKRWTLLGCVGAIALALVGCASSSVDASWGVAVAHLAAKQTAAPLGVEGEEPVQGIDAPTAQRVAERYYRGQEAQTTRQAATILIGK